MNEVMNNGIFKQKSSMLFNRTFSLEKNQPLLFSFFQPRRKKNLSLFLSSTWEAKKHKFILGREENWGTFQPILSRLPHRL